MGFNQNSPVILYLSIKAIVRELFAFTYLMSLSPVENSKAKEIGVYADMYEIELLVLVNLGIQKGGKIEKKLTCFSR